MWKMWVCTDNDDNEQTATIGSQFGKLMLLLLLLLLLMLTADWPSICSG